MRTGTSYITFNYITIYAQHLHIKSLHCVYVLINHAQGEQFRNAVHFNLCMCAK